MPIGYHKSLPSVRSCDRERNIREHSIQSNTPGIQRVRPRVRGQAVVIFLGLSLLFEKQQEMVDAPAAHHPAGIRNPDDPVGERRGAVYLHAILIRARFSSRQDVGSFNSATPFAAEGRRRARPGVEQSHD